MAGPAHVASFGPNSVNVTVAPATGFTRPLTVAVSVIVPPIVIGVTACVTIVGVASRTVVKFVPVPWPVCPSVAVPLAPASSLVWTPASARVSIVGTFSTLTVKLISQRAAAPPTLDGPSTTGTDGVKRYLSCAWSMLEIVNVVLAHAVPGSPVPVALSAKTSGSNDAIGQLTLAITPQLGTIVIVSSVMFCVACACVEALVMVNDDTTFV